MSDGDGPCLTLFLFPRSGPAQAQAECHAVSCVHRPIRGPGPWRYRPANHVSAHVSHVSWAASICHPGRDTHLQIIQSTGGQVSWPWHPSPPAGLRTDAATKQDGKYRAGRTRHTGHAAVTQSDHWSRSHRDMVTVGQKYQQL